MVRANPRVGLIMCGGVAGHQDPGVWDSVEARIKAHGLADHICMVDDLDHDAFLTVLSRSAIYLRTPITDGVASSVLESLALRVPVVACDNGTRPAGVVTYVVDDPADMANKVLDVLERRAEFVARLDTVALPDTIADEIQVLTEAP
jgi:glycosyltransferase involved in cell wall biosynthesis